MTDQSEPDPLEFIMDVFKAEFVNIRFTRMVKSNYRYRTRCKDINSHAN